MANDFIYSRVSTDDQTTLNQLHTLQREYPDASIVEETGSAYRGDQPVLKRLLAELVSGDRLIIWKLDRLGRRVARLAPLFEEFRERGITLISKGDNIDLSTPSGRLLAQIMSSVAENESANTSMRIRAALARLKDDDVKLGREKGFSPVTSKLKGMPGTNRKDRVKGYRERVWSLHKGGMSYRAIARHMTDIEGVKVSHQTIMNYVKEWKTQ